jgi:cytosine/adenosine deaminase-related metal-dependent hydrolase
VGGANALGRPDLGRLAKGCKADIVLADTSHPHLQPLRDPLRGLIFSALERPIRDVYIDGRQIVRDGKVLTIDVEKAIAVINEGQKRALVGVKERDWAKRTAEEAFPLALPVRERLH